MRCFCGRFPGFAAVVPASPFNYAGIAGSFMSFTCYACGTQFRILTISSNVLPLSFHEKVFLVLPFILDSCFRSRYCPTCKEHREATKEMSLWQLPDILIVQLKRFSFKNYLWRDKLDLFVDFPVV